MRRVPAIPFALFMASALLAAPAVANAQSDIVTLLSSSSYPSASTGSFYVVGEVRNDTPDPARYVQVKATFYDAASAAVASSFAFTDISILAPGEKSPLGLSFLQTKEQMLLQATSLRLNGTRLPPSRPR